MTTKSVRLFHFFAFLTQNSLRALKLAFLLLIYTSAGFSQVPFWHAGLFTFFDNNEFGKSAVKIPQTMAGVMIAPEIGLVWDSVHRINTGVNLMHEFGSPDFSGKVYPTAYYDYSSKPFMFIMGAFPRSEVLDKYPRLFFQDSVSYYRPNMNGIFCQYGKENYHIDLWLDWTGRQSFSDRETFFVGISGRYNTGMLYAQHFSYMYHFAGRMNPVFNEALHDNCLFLTSAGIDLSEKTFFDRLEANAGWVLGLERARADNTGWIAMHGLLIETKAEYRFAGLFNTFYQGRGQMYFYNNHDIDLYWGDPVYRARTYNRTDFYLCFLNKKTLNLELTYSLHILEGRVYHEQLLKVRVNLCGTFSLSNRQNNKQLVSQRI